jgi:hypothetical protein
VHNTRKQTGPSLSPMSHSAKAKAKGVSASSFFDLKAELSKQEAEFSKSRAAGRSNQIFGGVKRPDKVQLTLCQLLVVHSYLIETDDMGPSE